MSYAGSFAYSIGGNASAVALVEASQKSTE